MIILRRVRKPVALGIAALSLAMAGWIGWLLSPARTKASIIRAFPLGGSYATYERLAGMLNVGMSAEDVRAILGGPKTQEDVPGGRRWIYSEDSPTAGWLCIVDFALSGGTPRLSYFCNVRHIGFRTSPHREFGNPVDNGKFESVPLLRMRRGEWHTEGAPKNGGSFGAPRLRSVASDLVTEKSAG